MPTIDYSGKFQVAGRCTDRDSRGALSFPVKASTAQAARNFGNREILEMLPGWGRGSVRLLRNGVLVETYTLTRGGGRSGTTSFLIKCEAAD